MEHNIHPVILGSGRVARRLATRIYLHYGLRALAFSRTPSPMDRLFRLWHRHPLSPTIPDAVLVTALLEAAERQEGDRIPLLYLCGTDNFSLLTQYRSALEAAYILCDERGTPLSEHTADHGIKEVLL